MPSIITTSSLLPLLPLLLLLAPSPTGAAFKKSNKNTFDFSDRDTKDDWSSGSGKGGKNSGECSVPGGHLKVGQSKLYKKHQENCTMLLCEKDGLNSVLAQCYAPECHDSRMKGDKACCATCPNGRNCLLPDKTVLWGDNVTRVGNTLCRCPRIRSGLGWGDRLGVAECHVITTTAPTTTTPVPHCRLPQEKEKKKAQKGAGKKEEVELLAPGKESIVPKDDNCLKYVCNDRGQLTTYHGKCPALNCTNATREIGECCRVCPDGRAKGGARRPKPRYTEHDPSSLTATTTSPKHGHWHGHHHGHDAGYYSPGNIDFVEELTGNQGYCHYGKKRGGGGEAGEMGHYNSYSYGGYHYGANRKQTNRNKKSRLFGRR